jgi:uncharacterized repeat protein (TIGR01451 family)
MTMERESRRFLIQVLVLGLALILARGLVSACTLTVLPNDGSTSANARAPQTRSRYERSVYLITAAELATSGLANGSSITGIGWTYYTAPGLAGSGPLIVYLQNTTDTANTKSTTWSSAISGMTTVHNATTNLPNVTGSFDFSFSGGSAFTYSGGGVYVAFDWGQYTGTLSTQAVVSCNSTGLTNGLKGAQSNLSAPTTIAASSFRPETRFFVPGPTNDAAVDLLYSAGSLPLGVVSGSVFQARVTNNGSATLTNVPVTLSITGADTFSDTQTIPTLAACTSTTVSFAGYTPVALGSCTVTASVPADDNSVNNSKSHPLDVTANVDSYKYTGTTAGGGVGVAGSTFEALAKFRSDAASQVDSVILEFATTSATTYRVSVRGDDGTGLPGTQLYLDSADRTVTSAGTVTITLPSPVAVGPGNFFVGVQQTNTTNMSLSFDTENPIRAGAFYGEIPIGTAPWFDFAPGNDFKPNIGAIVGACLATLTVDVHPDVASACPGNNIVFTATATGTTGTVTYQWTEGGTDIPGANSSTYTATRATPGTSTYNCKVSDQGGCLNVQDATSSTGTWQAVTVTNPTVTTGTVGAAFSQAFTHAGGKPPITYSTTSTLPAGLTLGTDGTLSGTPTESGSFPITVTATDTDGCSGSGAEYPLTIDLQADLAITKTDGVTTATPGGSVTYTITASNAGPSNAPGSSVADTFPAVLTCTWTCVGAGGGTCTASGSGNINDTVNLPSGGSVTFTASCSISAAATGALANTASVTAPAGVADPSPGNNSATDSDTLSAQADLAITKTDGVTTATPGGSVTYTITASNAGPSNAPGSSVVDTFPAALTCTWTCVGAGGGTCTASGSGNINDTVNLPSGGSVTHTASCTISAAATGTLSNTATVTAPAGVADPSPGNNSATDTDTLNASADLAITKTASAPTVGAGHSFNYTIVATNNGPSSAAGAVVADTFPATLTGVSWTCAFGGGGSGSASGSGSINETVSLPTGATATYTVTATVVPGATGTISNTATVAPPAGEADPAPGNNTSTASIQVVVPSHITSAAGATFRINTPGTFTVTATGAPPITLSVSGTLPVEVVFKDNGNGTATLSGTPKPGTAGTYPITIKADNGYTDTQSFTLTVLGASTATTVTSYPNPSSAGQPVRLTGRVTFSSRGLTTPSGMIQFLANGSPLSPPIPMVGGAASLTWVPPAGTWTIRALYLGDGNFAPSSGALPGGQVVH